MAAGGKAAGDKAASGRAAPADDGLPVFRLRDIPMEPERGIQRGMSWLQFQGAVQLRMPLHGSAWEGVTAGEIEVSVSPEKLMVECKSRKGTNGSHLLESVNGKLRKEIDPQKCWYDIERDLSDPWGSNKQLVIELAKKTPKPWADVEIFNDELFQRRSFKWSSPTKQDEEAPGLVKLKPGRPLDVDDPYVATRGWLCSEFEEGQTNELVQFNILLDPKKFDEAVEKVPVNKLFAVDCTERSLKVFIRGDESSPILLGMLGGKVVPDQTSLKVNHVTREVEGHKIKGTIEKLPCLEVELVKSSDSLGEWEETIIQDEEVLNAPQGSLEDFERKQLKQKREPSPDREDWTPDDFADEQKEKADTAFKEGSYRDAIVYYTRGLRYTPMHHKILSNRSAAYLKISKFQLALDDATKAEQLEPNFAKIYFRKGQALKGLKRFDDAIAAFQTGQDIDPKNTEWEKEIHRAKETKTQLLERKAAKGRC